MVASWEKYLRESVIHPKDLVHHMEVDVHALQKVCEMYPMRINSYFLNLMKRKGVSLMQQVVPDSRELEDEVGWVDPLAEEQNSPVANLIHRYPDRILFLVSNQCGVYCRFCTRKRKIGKWNSIQDKEIEEGFYYIKNHKEILDVLLSGGDPLLLSDERLKWILMKIKEISHVEIVRIGTRIPSVLPQRVTSKLVRMLGRCKNLYVNVHFNHPDEITHEAEKSLFLLAEEGIPLGSQTVLLKGINDNASVISQLMRRLLKMRVRPYYLLHADLVRGTDHFRTSIDVGLQIMEHLRRTVSGMAVPTYILDLPGGGGKVPLLPEYIIQKTGDKIVIQNDQGRVYQYQNLRSSIPFEKLNDKALIEN